MSKAITESIWQAYREGRLDPCIAYTVISIVADHDKARLPLTIVGLLFWLACCVCAIVYMDSQPWMATLVLWYTVVHCMEKLSWYWCFPYIGKVE